MAREDMAHLRKFAAQHGVKAELRYSKAELIAAIRAGGLELPPQAGPPTARLDWLAQVKRQWTLSCSSAWAKLDDTDQAAFVEWLRTTSHDGLD